MQKYAFSIAIAALAVFLALLVACGEGEPNNLENNPAELGAIRNGIEALTDPTYGKIKDCVGKGTDEGCPSESASSAPPSGGGSSSSGGYGGGSSDSYTSSASKPPEYGDNCPESVTPSLPGFTCSWSPNPVEGGNTSKLSMSTYTVPKGMNCTPNKAWYEISESAVKYDTAFFELNKDIKISGAYLDLKLNGKYLSDAFKQWPKSGPLTVNGMITCTGTDAGKSYTCYNSKPCAPLTITPATAPTGNITLICADWDSKKLSEGTNNLPKNANLTACTTSGTISNVSAAGCSSANPTIEYCGGSTPSSCDASKAGTITVSAVATCKGGKYDLKTLTYNVRDNPTLTGTCVWTANGTTLTGTPPLLTNKSKTIKPQGVTLSNSYGRCKITGTTTSLSDGALPTTAYGGTNMSQWPTNGTLNITVNTNYTDIKTKVDCTPAVSNASCPSLTVNKGCTVTITQANTPVTVPNGECFDVRSNNTPGNTNGYWVICSTSAMGNISCFREIKYGSQGSTNAGVCNESGENTKVLFKINNSAGNAAKTFELEGINVGVYTYTSNDVTVQCLGNNWQEGASWVNPPLCNPAQQGIVKIKSGVTLPLYTGSTTIQCKLKSDSGNW